MRVDVPQPDAWGRLSDQYRTALAETFPSLKDAGLNVQVYAGVGHAVSEITKAIAKLFTHKKTIAIVQGVDQSFGPVAVQFSEEGFVVKNITREEAAKPETWSALIEELLFVLVCNDDPITARLYPFDGSAFTGKRVFQIHMCHESQRWGPVTRPAPFGVQIWSLSSDRSLMVAGERCKIQPQLAPNIFWRAESDQEITASLIPMTAADLSAREKMVREFESNLPAGFKAYFGANEPRLFDRTVIYHPDYDGSAIIDELAVNMQISIKRAGETSPFETTSACRWESPRFIDWLISRGETEATTRGLVIVSSDLIDRGLATHLATAAAKIARLQNG